MDKEAMETKTVYGISEDLLGLPFLQSKQGLAWQIAECLFKLGYHKSPSEPPPILSDGEIKNIINTPPTDEELHRFSCREARIAQAQIDLLKKKGYL